MQHFNIRYAMPDDLSTLMPLIDEHAEWESGFQVRKHSDLGDLRDLLFAPEPKLFCLVVEKEGQLFGYATCTKQYSTWQACSYLYVDCLYLVQEARGLGLGRAVMQRLNTKAQELRCRHLEWQTPERNAGAIGFYNRLGAVANSKQRYTWPIQTGLPATSDTVQPKGSIRALPADALLEPYRCRPTQSVGVRSCRGWQLKVYQIVRENSDLPVHVIDNAMDYLETQVPWPKESVSKKYGFVVLHAGQQALWLLVHLWLDDILRHFVYYAPVDNWTHFSSSPMEGFNACVWELEVIKHERDAWVTHAMSQPKNPDFAAYLQDTLFIPFEAE